MAHFYVSAKGSRSAVHRLGGMNSGVQATLASYQGSISVWLYHENGIDCVQVSSGCWQGAGEEREIYNGPINRPLAREIKKRPVKKAVR